jgi:hypothetical protein
MVSVFETTVTILKINKLTTFIFQNMLSLVMLCTSDIYLLITYSSIVESVFIMLSVTGILWLRWKQPEMVRPIKVCWKMCSFYMSRHTLLGLTDLWYLPEYETTFFHSLQFSGKCQYSYYSGFCVTHCLRT